MRLESFRLLRYGPFEDFSIKLDAEPGRLNIVCAPNGAGKSVLRQAFEDLLFGISGQTSMGFRFGYPGMRLAATAVTQDGQHHQFGRRKGQGSTWTDPDGAPLANPAIAAAFARTDSRVLERLFSLDTKRLRDGGDKLLTEGGQLADALLAAGGLSGARAVQRELAQMAETLAPQRKVATRPYYLALDEFISARRKANEALIRPDAWERLTRETDEAAVRLETCRAAAATAAAEAARLQRIRRIRVPVAEHDDAEAWLTENDDAPDLPLSLAQRLAEARQHLVTASQREQIENTLLAKLLAEQRTITVDDAVLSEAASIDEFAEMAGAVGKALTDIPQRNAEHAQVQSRITRLLRRLGSDLPITDASRLIPDRAAEARSRALIGQYEARATALQAADETLAAVVRDIAEKRATLVALPATSDTAEIAALMSEIGNLNAQSAQSDDTAAALDRAEAELAAALAQVPSWRGTAAELQAMTLPPDPSCERIHQALVNAENILVRQDDTLEAARARHREAGQAAQSLGDSGEIPDRAAIVGARRTRDELYALIAPLAFGGSAAPPDEIARQTGGIPLALAYEQAVARADRLADRQVDESQLIARAHEFARQLRDAEQALAAASAANLDAKMAAESALRAWQATLPSCLPQTVRLDDLRKFIAARTRVIERTAIASEARSRATRLAERHRDWADRLARALSVPPAPFFTLLATAERRLSLEQQSERERRSLEGALAERNKQREAAIAERAKAANALSAWHKDWSASLTALGRPNDETPAVTGEVLGLLAELEREVEQSFTLLKRIEGMQQDNAEFTRGVTALAGRLDPPLAAAGDTQTMLIAIRTLRDRLKENRDNDSRRRQLARQIQQVALTVADLANTRAARENELDAVIQACGATSAEIAEQRLAAAAARASHLAALERARARLLVDGDGLTLDELRNQVASLSPDKAAPALASAEAQAAAAQSEAQSAAAAYEVLKYRQEECSRDTSYEEARHAEAEAAATAGRILTEALTARLAAGMLARAMASVETAGGSDMLARIGARLKELTGGFYSRVATEDGENGGQVLVAIPSDRPDEIKRMEQLSEGERDQLYLAMRLEAVAAHPDQLPFIADDILQSFDNTRAEAALRALLKLSDRVQVIVLTHHRHILTLAESLPTGSVHIEEFA